MLVDQYFDLFLCALGPGQFLERHRRFLSKGRKIRFCGVFNYGLALGVRRGYRYCSLLEKESRSRWGSREMMCRQCRYSSAQPLCPEDLLF